jgi:hypothetical protein
MRISALRCAGTLSHGESRKKSLAEKWEDGDDAVGGKGYAVTERPVRTLNTQNSKAASVRLFRTSKEGTIYSLWSQHRVANLADNPSPTTSKDRERQTLYSKELTFPFGRYWRSSALLLLSLFRFLPCSTVNPSQPPFTTFSILQQHPSNPPRK